MKTAKAIENMTDSAEFEILATRILRLTEDNCRNLEHSGVNADGKTIKNPLDGFCIVPGSNPPCFIMTAYTIEKKERLKHKWTYDHSKSNKKIKASNKDDGDLIKASRDVNKLKIQFPNAKFILYLGTNKIIDKELITYTYSFGGKLGIGVRFLGLSQIRDFLDTTPEGQWLRKEHLKINANILSQSLLCELSKCSLNQYYNEFHIISPKYFSFTSKDCKIQASISNKIIMNILLGPSGSGKSVSCFNILKEHIILMFTINIIKNSMTF